MFRNLHSQFLQLLFYFDIVFSQVSNIPGKVVSSVCLLVGRTLYAFVSFLNLLTTETNWRVGFFVCPLQFCLTY